MATSKYLILQEVFLKIRNLSLNTIKHTLKETRGQPFLSLKQNFIFSALLYLQDNLEVIVINFKMWQIHFDFFSFKHKNAQYQKGTINKW